MELALNITKRKIARGELANKRDLFIKFGKYAKNYRSGKSVEKAFDKWLDKLEIT